MEKVYVWIGGVGAWSDPANWRYGEYNGPGFYDPLDFGRNALSNVRAATDAPDADDTASFGVMGGRATGGGAAARLVGHADGTTISLADTTTDGRADVFRFGSVEIQDRTLHVDGAVLVSRRTALDTWAEIDLRLAGSAVDQWGRTYSADLGALALQTEFRPSGTWSGAVVVGKNIVEADSITGNRTVRTDAYDPTGRTGPIGGLYSDTGTDYRLDPTAAPGFWFGGVPLVRQGDAWSLDLHVAQGDNAKTFALGAVNIGTGGALTYQIAGLDYGQGWSLSSLPVPRNPLWAGSSGADLAVNFNATTPGVHTLTAVLRTSETSSWVGHAAFADQTLTVRVTVEPPKAALSLSLDRPGQFEGKPGDVPTAYTFTVKLGAAADGQQTVRWAVEGGALSPTDAADFTGATSGSLVFDAGETQKSIVVNVAGDATAEQDETFIVRLSGPSGGLALPSQDYALATVLTDDRPPSGPPPVHVTAAQAAAWTATATRMVQNLDDPWG